MSRLPDLVLDSKIETHFRKDYVRHLFHEADPTSAQRAKFRKEYWKRDRCIGRGAFASVWLENCVRGECGPKVRAVKQLAKPASEKDYLRELESIAKFSHPRYARCFVRSLGWYEDDNDLYIAMEYLPNGDLHNYLKAEPALPELDAQQIAIQICEGLSMMHENGFAHRDLKPGNILIHSRPPHPWWVKISDFGISKRTEHTVAGPSTRKGTETFMPPEWHGFGSGDEEKLPSLPQAIDMWSLGEIISRMVTKEPTFKSSYDLFRFAESQDTFPEQSLLAHDVSADAIDLIKALMKLLPEDRLSASQALQHSWLLINSPGHSSEPSIASLDSLSETRDSDLSDTDSDQLDSRQIEPEEATVGAKSPSDGPNRDSSTDSRVLDVFENNRKEISKEVAIVDDSLGNREKARHTGTVKNPPNKQAIYKSSSESPNPSEREDHSDESKPVRHKKAAMQSPAGDDGSTDGDSSDTGSGTSRRPVPPRGPANLETHSSRVSSLRPGLQNRLPQNRLPEIVDWTENGRRQPPSSWKLPQSPADIRVPQKMLVRGEEDVKVLPRRSETSYSYTKQPADLTRPLSRLTPPGSRAQPDSDSNSRSQGEDEGPHRNHRTTFREPDRTRTRSPGIFSPQPMGSKRPPELLYKSDMVFNADYGQWRNGDFAISPRGDLLAVWWFHWDEAPAIEVWDMRTGRRRHRYQSDAWNMLPYDGPSCPLELSPTSKYLRLICPVPSKIDSRFVPTVEVWDVERGRQLDPDIGGEDCKIAVFSQDGTKLAMCRHDRIIVRDLETWDASSLLCQDVTSVYMEGRIIAVTTGTQHIRMFNWLTKEEILRTETIYAHGKAPTWVSSPRTSAELFFAKALVRVRNGVYVHFSNWRPHTTSADVRLDLGERRLSSTEEKNWLDLHALSAKGNLVALKYGHDTVIIFDTRTKACIVDKSLGIPVAFMRFLESGTLAIVGISDDRRTLWVKRLYFPSPLPVPPSYSPKRVSFTKGYEPQSIRKTESEKASEGIDDRKPKVRFMHDLQDVDKHHPTRKKKSTRKNGESVAKHAPRTTIYGPEDVRWSRGRETTLGNSDDKYVKPPRMERAATYMPEDIRRSRGREPPPGDNDDKYVKPPRMERAATYMPEDIRRSRNRRPSPGDDEDAESPRIERAAPYGPEDVRWSRGREPPRGDSDDDYAKPSMQRTSTYAY